MIIPSRDTNPYYPLSESQGGWRFLKNPNDIKHFAQMDSNKIDQLFDRYSYFFGAYSSGIVIIRHGYIVGEYYTFMTLPSSRFDVWSCTKSFTSTAWGLILDYSKKNFLSNNQKITLDNLAYSLLPKHYKISDKRKEKITIRHLLTMTSGIPGEASGVYGIPTTIENGAFEHALGYCKSRYGKRTDKLIAEPGTKWEYSDPGVAHLSLLFSQIMSQEIHNFMKEKVFNPIGIEQASWDVLGGGDFIGPHTSAHIGINISARELARFGYLALHQGIWKDKELIPKWWMELATQSSQGMNPNYGYMWWVNSNGTRWPSLPKDMFALEGYNSNRCYIIPSLDLIVSRVGSGPPEWNEQMFINEVINTIIKN